MRITKTIIEDKPTVTKIGVKHRSKKILAFMKVPKGWSELWEPKSNKGWK